MKIEVPIGEIIDKLSICEIKTKKINDELKLKNVFKEYKYLLKITKDKIKIDLNSEEYLNIFELNLKLWDVEEELRHKEEKKEFDKQFIELARMVYYLNDIRASLKKQFNIKYNSKFIEEKSYKHL